MPPQPSSLPNAPHQDSWSPEEDARLRTLYSQYGTSWSRISKALKGRTSQQCRARWHQLDSGRSRRSGGGAATGGGSGSGGAGSIAGGGRAGASVKQRSSAQRGRRERYDSSGSEEDYEDGEEPLSDSGEGEEDVAADGDAKGGAVKHHDDGDGSGQQGAGPAPRRRPAAHKQGPAGATAVATAAASRAPAVSPRRPPRGAFTSGASSGASTPKRRGDGAPDSPAIPLVSPRLMSPPGAPGGGGGSRLSAGEDADAAGWQQLAQAQGLDEQEAAGAETLLHIASVFRRGSGDLEPPAASLRRSDFITGVTPTKRSPARRPGGRLSDDLSPSPFKKAHSLTAAEAAAGASAGGDLLASLPDFKSRLAAAAADADEELAQEQRAGGSGRAAAGGSAAGTPRSGSRRLTAKRSARRAGSALPFRSDDNGSGSGDADGDEPMDDAVGESDGGSALPGPIGFDLVPGAVASGFVAGPAGSLASPLPRGAAGASSSLLSPRPMQTPGKEAMAMLTSPKFEVLATGAWRQPAPGSWVAVQGMWRQHMSWTPLWWSAQGLALPTTPLVGNTGFLTPASLSDPAIHPSSPYLQAARRHCTRTHRRSRRLPHWQCCSRRSPAARLSPCGPRTPALPRWVWNLAAAAAAAAASFWAERSLRSRQH
jgi:hypothetical protein